MFCKMAFSLGMQNWKNIHATTEANNIKKLPPRAGRRKIQCILIKGNIFSAASRSKAADA